MKETTARKQPLVELRTTFEFAMNPDNIPSYFLDAGGRLGSGLWNLVRPRRGRNACARKQQHKKDAFHFAAVLVG
jgi:hypothetical protein